MALNPSIADDLWAYDSGIPDLVKGLPRWWASDSYSKRDHILQSIKTWHAHARENFDRSQIGPDGDWDTQFGSRFIRERQRSFPQMDGMDDDAMAASDLGAIWAELRFDIDKLTKNDLLQSIYAEALRLRIAAFIMRSPEREDMKINEWVFPKDEIALVATTPAHMDETVWNTGHMNEHPTNTFWAERFLVCPGDPTSGPRKNLTGDQKVSEKKQSGRPYFSLDGLAGSWIPYGGGFRACPSRTFAKREILMTLAVMVTLFDIEVDGSKAQQTDPRQSGLGAQRPNLQYHHIILAVRSIEKGTAARSRLLSDPNIRRSAQDAQIHVVELDLASFSSVTQCVDCVKAKCNGFAAETEDAMEHRREISAWKTVAGLDIPILNAGTSVFTYEKTHDGHERMLQVNYLSNILLTLSLLPLLVASAKRNGTQDGSRG
ncbi:MAG: hypothetical protein Q9166_002641 [cf. Caloplaca sp. 2 TL-2023]